MSAEIDVPRHQDHIIVCVRRALTEELECRIRCTQKARKLLMSCVALQRSEREPRYHQPRETYWGERERDHASQEICVYRCSVVGEQITAHFQKAQAN